MRRTSIPLAAFALCGLAVRADAVVLEPARVEVVAEAKACPTVRFAAAEMTNFLSRVLGAPVPLVAVPQGGGRNAAPTAGETGWGGRNAAPTAGETGWDGGNAAPTAGDTVSIVLGDTAWSRAAGIDVARLGQDAYVTRVGSGRIYIAGRDDPNVDLVRAMGANGGGYGMYFGHDRATLFGVYGFLEEKAGVRFYLPDDELGVVVPRRDRIELADGEWVTAPNFTIREPYMGGDGVWYNATKAFGSGSIKCLEWLRLRMGVRGIPCCHGSRDFHYIERFAKTHPEYMALKGDGTRWLDPNVFAAYQLCWTNPDLQETMYQDIKTYLTGGSASSRGLKHWGNNCRYGRYVDIMPDDSFQGCRCARCQAAYVHRPKDPHYATELMWGIASKFARRLQDEGVKGDVVLMSYTPYGRVPDFTLPTNVQVMVATGGPWSLARPGKTPAGDKTVMDWTEKLGHKVWVWTYPHKFGGTMIRGVPCMAPHAWGKYFKTMSPWIFGTFAESESDKAVYNHLNYYVFSRVAWNAATDVDAVVREYHDLMFGPAAGEMRRFNAILERKWLVGVAGRVEQTAVGPIAKAPSAYQLWREIYSRETREELSGLIRAAIAKVPKDSLEARRIALMYREFLKPLLVEAVAYGKATDVKAALARRAKEPNRSIVTPVGTRGHWGGDEFTIDREDCVSAAGAVRFSGTHTASVRTSLPRLKPNTKYRLSYFVKVKDVQPFHIPGGSSGGVSVNVWDDKNIWFPSSVSKPKGNWFTGTMDWIYQEFEFTSGPLSNNTDPAKGKVHHSYLQLHILYAAGEAWFDDLRLEEIGDETNGR